MTKPETVEVGTRRMREIFDAAVENYHPTIGGHAMAEEGGVTDASLRNIEECVRQINQIPVSVELSGDPNDALRQVVFFQWPGFECYTATGFSWGYLGTGPSGLARALVICGLIKEEERHAFYLTHIAGRPQNEFGVFVGNGYCPYVVSR